MILVPLAPYVSPARLRARHLAPAADRTLAAAHREHVAWLVAARPPLDHRSASCAPCEACDYEPRHLA